MSLAKKWSYATSTNAPEYKPTAGFKNFLASFVASWSSVNKSIWRCKKFPAEYLANTQIFFSLYKITNDITYQYFRMVKR
jgi:hypothetical protein